MHPLYCNCMATTSEQTFNKHVVVAGFVGSFRQEIGALIAEGLGLGVVDTFDEHTQQALARGDKELASRSETAYLADLLDGIPPRLILMRPESFARARTRGVMSALGAVSLFVDTEPEVCQDRITDTVGLYGRRLSSVLFLETCDHDARNVASRRADMIIPYDGVRPIDGVTAGVLAELRAYGSSDLADIGS